MFIWDFVADKILGQIVDWFYGQVVGFLGNFFAEMGPGWSWLALNAALSIPADGATSAKLRSMPSRALWP